MLIAWMFTASTGMMIARYLKAAMGEGCCRKDSWFVVGSVRSRWIWRSSLRNLLSIGSERLLCLVSGPRVLNGRLCCSVRRRSCPRACPRQRLEWGRCSLTNTTVSWGEATVQPYYHRGFHPDEQICGNKTIALSHMKNPAICEIPKPALDLGLGPSGCSPSREFLPIWMSLSQARSPGSPSSRRHQ